MNKLKKDRSSFLFPIISIYKKQKKTFARSFFNFEITVLCETKVVSLHASPQFSQLKLCSSQNLCSKDGSSQSYVPMEAKNLCPKVQARIYVLKLV